MGEFDGYLPMYNYNSGLYHLFKTAPSSAIEPIFKAASASL